MSFNRFSYWVDVTLFVLESIMLHLFISYNKQKSNPPKGTTILFGGYFCLSEWCVLPYKQSFERHRQNAISPQLIWYIFVQKPNAIINKRECEAVVRCHCREKLSILFANILGLWVKHLLIHRGGNPQWVIYQCLS